VKIPEKCACVHPDAERCLQSRYAGFYHDEDARSYMDEKCECSCHMKDEDGFDEWDDKERTDLPE